MGLNPTCVCSLCDYTVEEGGCIEYIWSRYFRFSLILFLPKLVVVLISVFVACITSPSLSPSLPPPLLLLITIFLVSKPVLVS